MNDLNILIENYNSIYPCLAKIINNKDKAFRNNNHIFIFSFLLGYFTKNKININDLNEIISQYQKDIYIGNDFLSDFKKISYIFCSYYQNKNLNYSDNSINNSNQNFINNNNNNFINNINNNFINNSNNNFMNNSKNFTNNGNINSINNSNNNFINNSNNNIMNYNNFNNNSR